MTSQSTENAIEERTTCGYVVKPRASSTCFFSTELFSAGAAIWQTTANNCRKTRELVIQWWLASKQSNVNRWDWYDIFMWCLSILGCFARLPIKSLLHRVRCNPKRQQHRWRVHRFHNVGACHFTSLQFWFLISFPDISFFLKHRLSWIRSYAFVKTMKFKVP